MPSQIINPTGYFSDMMELFQMARRGRVYLLRPTARINPIHATDLAKACIDRLEHGGPDTGDLGGPDVLTWAQIAELAFAAIDQPPRTTTIPANAMNLITRLIALWNPRQADTLRFAAWQMSNDCIGTPTGDHHLAEFLHRAGERSARTECRHTNGVSDRTSQLGYRGGQPA